MLARNVAAVRLLLEHGADVHAQNLHILPTMARYAAAPEDIAARMFAQHNGGRLLDAGATPLHLAAAFADDAVMIKTLLSLDVAGTHTSAATGALSAAVSTPLSVAASAATSAVTSAPASTAVSTSVATRISTLVSTAIPSAVPAAVPAADASVQSRRFALHWPAALSRQVPLHGLVDLHRSELHTRAAGGQTPLHYAARFGANAEVITALVDAGAELEARTVDRRTPLHLAAADSTHPDIIIALCAAGADTTARDSDGNTPQQRYEQRGLAWPILMPSVRESE